MLQVLTPVLEFKDARKGHSG